MKKTAAVLLSAAMMLGIALPTAFAEDTTESVSETETATVADDTNAKTYKDSDGNTYSYVENKKGDTYYSGENKELYKDDTVRISAFSGKEKGKLEIPDEIDGKDVTAIADNVFSEVSATSVTIPKTVTVIGSSVFAGMKNCKEFDVEKGNENFKSDDGVLYSKDGTTVYAYPIAKSGTEYEIESNVSTIAAAAFTYTNLSSITMPQTVSTIGKWAFAYTPITEMTFSRGVKAIYDYAFAYCDKLENPKLPTQLTYIGSAAFADCKKITEIKIPETVTEIGQYAFAGTSLTSVRIPSSVQTIGYCAFGYTENADKTGFEAVKDFTIYGASGSQGEDYATDEDEENDYKNNFKFVSDEETSETEIEEGNTSESLNWTLVISIILGGVIIIAIIVIIALVAVHKVDKKSSDGKDNSGKHKKQKEE